MIPTGDERKEKSSLATEQRKAAIAKYNRSAKHTAAQRRYRQTLKGKLCEQKYLRSQAYKLANNRYRSKPHVKHMLALYRKGLRAENKIRRARSLCQILT